MSYDHRKNIAEARRREARRDRVLAAMLVGLGALAAAALGWILPGVQGVAGYVLAGGAAGLAALILSMEDVA
jgi:hypothetical protein